MGDAARPETKGPVMLADIERVRAACCVAAVDGTITPAEHAMLRALAERSGVSDESLAAMLESAQTDPGFARRQFEMVQADPAETITALLRIAQADGAVADEERAVLVGFGVKLGMTPDDAEAAVRAHE